MKDITLALSLDEVNVVLEALGSRPYAQVSALVGKVTGQAREQLQEVPDGDAAE